MGNQNITIPVTESSKIDEDIPVDDPFLVVDADPDVNEEYEPDISDSVGQLVTVHLALTEDSNPAVVKYSKDGGNSKVNFLNGDQLTAGSGLERPILLRKGNKLNFYADAIVKLQFCEVDLV